MAQVTNGVKSKVWTFLDYMMFVYIDIHTKPLSTELIKVQCGLMAPQDLLTHTNLLCKIQEKKRNIFFHSLKMDMPEELKYVLFNNNNINGFRAGEFKQFIPVMQVMPSLMDTEIS